ncbi:Hypothetical predicted protein [Paramuricea clavata]|uniref:Uncharacterized protein n=1 Tax=Paramuricea clavata TaxID=317549 RepID=A0A6S7L526_PARCT|nr:Hypothetical predicted protein [Paramuricea clavata]
MTEPENGVSDSAKELSSTPSISKKRRFQLGAYQRTKSAVLQAELLKKAEKKVKKVQEIKVELQELNENSPDKCLSNTSNAKQPRKPSQISESCSDKLNLSRSQQMRRKKRTLAAVRSVHCVANTRPTNSESKAANDGLWTTLLGTASASEMATYISQSKMCMEKVLPGIVNSKIKEYQLSTPNQVRSMRVLYEGGLLGKRKYTRVCNSCDIIETGDNKKRKCQIMEGCEK